MARLFHRLLAAIFLIAWLSLAVQIRILIGSRGLLPVESVGDGWLVAGTWLGAALGLAGMLVPWPRALLVVQVPLYLLYTRACRDFLGFQWDNLLLETGVLALFLPTDRPAPLARLALRLLLVKLYFESGLAKWQSHIHDWQDGSAMSFYYETAPLPTPLAFFAHHLPGWWHAFESRAVLVLELIVPFALVAPRRPRLVAGALLTGFQLVNLATANYGFFVWLTLVLHVMILDEGRPAAPPPRWRTIAGALLLSVWLALSAREGLAHFAGWSWFEPPLRLVNTYHLFAHITRERIEPEFQLSSGEGFAAYDLRFKAGDVRRAPPFVAPHQPRVDFLLWFYGLAPRRAPEYVARLVERLCHDPDAVAPLFAAPLPRAPAAVQIVFWEYHFAPAGSDAWWTRSERGRIGPIDCVNVGSR